jgi:hypothetical protein
VIPDLDQLRGRKQLRDFESTAATFSAVALLLVIHRAILCDFLQLVFSAAKAEVQITAARIDIRIFTEFVMALAWSKHMGQTSKSFSR